MKRQVPQQPETFASALRRLGDAYMDLVRVVFIDSWLGRAALRVVQFMTRCIKKWIL